MKEEVFNNYDMMSNYCAPAAQNYQPMMQSIAGGAMDYGGMERA